MLQVLINPIAGNGRAQRIGAQILRVLSEKNIQHDSCTTEYAGHATLLARRAAEAGADSVLAVGGDGTVLETSRGLLGTEAALGIIPAGTGNDMVKTLGVPQKPMEALEHILSHPPRRMDAGTVNGELFLNACGTGFDVCVLNYAQRAKKYVQGLLPYLWGVLRALFSFRSIDACIQTAETTLRKPLLVFSIANGRFIGGGIQIAPLACPDDGKLDMLTIDAMPRWRMPLQLVKLLTGKVLSIPGAVHGRVERVCIRAENMRVNVDGEIVSLREAVFEILPEALLAHW